MYVLDKLWRGEVAPCGRHCRENSEAQRLSSVLADKSAALNSLMPEELRKLWEEYNDIWNKLEWLSTQDSYVEGLRFGILLMLDVLGGNEENYVDKEERA